MELVEDDVCYECAFLLVPMPELHCFPVRSIVGVVSKPSATLSLSLHIGLVHIAQGESSECIPLSEWLRFSTLFNVLRNIR